MAADDAFLDKKAIEGTALFASIGAGCYLPVPGLIQESILRPVSSSASLPASPRSAGRRPLDAETMIAPRLPGIRSTRSASTRAIGAEGAQCLIGERAHLGGDLSEGCYIQPTPVSGSQQDAHLPGGDFGPVLAVTTFKDGRKPWRSPTTRSWPGFPVYGPATAARAPTAWAATSRPAGVDHLPCHPARGFRRLQSPASAAKPMNDVDHYQQTKNILVSYSPNKLGFF